MSASSPACKITSSLYELKPIEIATNSLFVIGSVPDEGGPDAGRAAGFFPKTLPGTSAS